MSGEGPIGPILAALERLEAGQQQMRSDLMARMDRLQNAISSIRDDIATNYGTADHVRRAHDNTREELRAVVDVQSAMLRQIQRLQSEVRALKGEPL